MLKKLKEVYQEKCLIGEIPTYPNDYFWFKDEDSHLIAIHKSVSPQEKKLISIMFDEIQSIDFDQHNRLQWIEFLLRGEGKILKQFPQKDKKLKFIIFNHNFDSDTKMEFDMLIKQFDKEFLSLFIDKQYGVIIDFNSQSHYSIEELEDFVDAVRQDFYYPMTFYQTKDYLLTEDITNSFLEELEIFKKYSRSYLLVMQQQDLLLQSLVKNVNSHEFRNYKEKIKDIPTDQIEVVKCYLENNFNLSLGAKKLHMHRNTFMNKLERFIQSSGVNVKEFREGMVAYLLIECLKTDANM